MRMKFHGYDPAACKPGDKGEWEMLEDEQTPAAKGKKAEEPAPAPVKKGKSPAMDYLKGKKA